MKKLVKIFGILAVLLILLLVVAVVIIGSSIDSMAKAGIEAVGSEVTGTAVTVDKVALSIFDGSGSVASIVVGNPEGFKTDGALKVGEAKVKIQPATVLDKVVMIDEILVNGAEVTIEIENGKSNLGEILNNINKLLESYPSSPSAEGDTKVVISHFLLQDLTVRVKSSLLGDKEKTFSIEQVELKDIGEKSGGKTAIEAAGQIIKQVLGISVKKAAQNQVGIPDIDKDSLMDTIKGQAEEKGKNIFGRLKDSIIK